MGENCEVIFIHHEQQSGPLELRVQCAWRQNKNNRADLHLYLCAVDLLSDGFNDANHNVLQAFSLWVVVKNQIVPLLSICAAERGSPHPGIDGTEVVM